MRFGGFTDKIVSYVLVAVVGWSICYAQYHVPQLTKEAVNLEFANKNWAAYADTLEKGCR